MIPASFEYVRPASLDEALGLLGDDGTKIIAGGQSLLPLMKLRLARPERLVDIGALAALRGTRRLADGALAIGGLTRYVDLMTDPAVVAYAALTDALPSIGDVQVRNRGTIGGALAHCDPASDLPAVLLAFDAQVVARSRRGERTIALADFFEGPFQTALAADEILTEVHLP
ncbi:MAG TPA: FAD binding domain-containing protein, partial [Candidatus Limnocylindrales bacterium]